MQRVCIKGVTSSWLEVLSGVPQGSVLGPILFLIYINDLDNGVKNWILKFADDTKIFGAVNNDTDRSVLQKDLDNLLMWAEECQMMFNMLKCKVMHLGYKNHGYSYYMDGKELDTVEEAKGFRDNHYQRLESFSVLSNVNKPMQRQAGCLVVRVHIRAAN